MDFDDTEEDAAFRREVSVWLEEHAEVRTGLADWSRNPTHPITYAAAANGSTPSTKVAGVPSPGPRNTAGVAKPPGTRPSSIRKWPSTTYRLEHSPSGSAWPGRRSLRTGPRNRSAGHLPAMLRGEAVWCQLFSEPDAGSDLAGLKSRAERDGESFVVNGQKVWTSGAQHSDWAILIARTNPDVPKHKGITYFLVDMHSPGIEVRPLRQITGTAHFNEVFLTDVVIPAANVVGEVNGGWTVAHTTMSYERALIGGTGPSIPIAQVLDLARRCGRSSDPLVRQQIAEFYTRVAAPSVHELPRADGTLQGSSAWSRGIHHETVPVTAHGSQRGTVHEPVRRQRHVGR